MCVKNRLFNIIHWICRLHNIPKTHHFMMAESRQKWCKLSSNETEGTCDKPQEYTKASSGEAKVIEFNSKSPEPLCYLSNFFGNPEQGIPEFEYQSGKFRGASIDKLMENMQNCSGTQFLTYLIDLQPQKKWTNSQKLYWFKGSVPHSSKGDIDFDKGKPIRGILAKLVASSATNTKRKQKVEALAGSSFSVVPEVNDREKQAQMLVCLRHKYADPFYRDILLSTGDAVLHEKPMRGGPNAWTHKWHKDHEKRGGDWLGKLLMKIRKEIRDDK